MPNDDLTGQTIRGYELRESIGAGGFGAVYHAYQAAIRRQVAVKVILPQFANEPEFIRRFEAEAQIVARLEHPFIVPLYDFWRDPSGAYLVMRWLPGGSLRSLTRKEFLPLPDLARILDQISAALALAHRRGVVHLDLKPDNILLDDERNGYLADFGIAMSAADLAAEKGSDRTITGTPAYLAPEQISGAPITVKADLYSLGIMLYELLIGDPPFTGLTPTQLLQKHLYETLPPLSLRRANLPVALNAVVQKTTAKNPAERYPDALSVAAAFRQALGEPTGESARENAEYSAPTRRTTGRVGSRPDTPRISDGPDERTITPESSPDRPDAIDDRTITPADAIGDRTAFDRTVTPADAPLVQTPIERTFTPADGLVAEALDNPYKGLRAFEEADAGDFFGREVLVEQLGARLAQSDILARFLAVVGPSGSGKSSAVKAGLIPALRRGVIPGLQGAARWFVVEMTPSPRPFTELSDALGRVATSPLGNLTERLSQDSDGLLTAVQELLPTDPRFELLLVIDQFEELFTQAADPTDPARFLDALLTAVSTIGSRLRVIITLRADFYDRPLLYPGFGELVRKRTEIVLPLATDDLRRVIALPAERAGLTLEAGLSDAILRDVSDQPGALPLLQYALTELFQRRQDRTLTLAAYQASGGVIGALARRADALFTESDVGEQALLQQIFLRLVTPGEGVEDTRRRVLRPELSLAADDDAAVDAILNRFGQYRLLTFDRDPVTRIPTIEVAHEALIRTWERLRGWLSASREDIQIQRRLAAATAEWMTSGRDGGFLASEARLSQFEGWAANTSLALSRDETEYLATSVAEREARHARDEARKAREELIARRAQTFGRAAAILAIVGTLAMIATVVAGIQAANANAQVAQANDQLAIAAQTLTPVPATLTPISLTLAAGKAQIIAAAATGTQVSHQITSVQLAAEAGRVLEDPNGGPEPSMLLAIRALQVAYSPEADLALTNALDHQYAVRALVGHTDVVNAVAVSPDNKYVLSASNDGTARLWDLATGKLLQTLAGHTGHVLSAAFAPDGQSAATGGADKTIRLWRIPSGTLIKHFTIGAAVLSLALSPDGSQLVTGGDDHSAHVWDVQTGNSVLTLTGHTGVVESVAFSPDGSKILTGSQDQTARLWDARSGAAIRTFTGHIDAVLSVAFSPDGTSIVTSGDDQTARLWDVASGAQRLQFGGQFAHGQAVDSVSFSPDGTQVLTASPDLTAKLWDTQSGSLIRTFAGHDDAINAAAFAPDGQSIVTTSSDHTLRVWATQAIPGNLIGHTLPITSLAFSPDGSRVVTGSSDQTVRVWDTHTDQELAKFGVHQPVEVVAFTPDGNGVIIADVKNGVQLLDIKTGQVIRSFVGHTGQLNAVAVSPNGTLLLTGSADHTARLWNAQSGAQLHVFAHADWVMGVAFAPDGQSVLTGSFDGTAKTWDVHTGALLHTFDAAAGKVWAVAFAPDGQMVLTGGYIPSTARLWDVHSGALLQTFSSAASQISTVAFTPDKRSVFVLSLDGIVHVWSIQTGAATTIQTGSAADVQVFALSADGTQIAFGHATGPVQLRPVEYQAYAQEACARLVRDPIDFTKRERKALSITDSAPNCPPRP